MAHKPLIFDVRPEGHSSFSVLPKLGQDEFDRLQAFYKFNVLTTFGEQRAKPGERYWQLYAIELKAGPAIVQPQVWDVGGSLYSSLGVLIFGGWPGMSLDDQLIPGVDPRYFDKAKAAFTYGNTWSLQYNQEAHIGPSGGPFYFWLSSDPQTASDRRVGSDCIERVGYWDEHIVPNPIFREVRKESTGPVGDTGLWMYKDGEAFAFIPAISGQPPTSGFNGLGFDNGTGNISWYVHGVVGTPQRKSLITRLWNRAVKVK